MSCALYDPTITTAIVLCNTTMEYVPSQLFTTLERCMFVFAAWSMVALCVLTKQILRLEQRVSLIESFLYNRFYTGLDNNSQDADHVFARALMYKSQPVALC